MWTLEIIRRWRMRWILKLYDNLHVGHVSGLYVYVDLEVTFSATSSLFFG